MFGKLLRNLIEKKYESLAKFSEECGISKGHLTDILNNRILPKTKTMNIFVEKLQLKEEEKKQLLREWAFDKSEGILRKDFEELEKQNKNMLEVLKTVKKEKELLEEISQLKEYENFYNLFFEELSGEETKIVLNAMVRELKAISVDNGKTDTLKKKFEQLEKVIESIE